MLTWSQKFRLRGWMYSSLTLVPVGFVIGAIVMSQLLPQFDLRAGTAPPFTYSASSAQATLSAISSGMIAFTGFVFSVLTFAIQYGSTAFTPRLLRSISTDGTTKLALGVFVATFTYSLLLLAEVAPAETQYVPQWSVLFAVVMVGASILVFLRLIASLTSSLRTGLAVAGVGRMGRAVIEKAYPQLVSTPESFTKTASPNDAEPRLVSQPGQGSVLQAYGTDGLVALAAQADALIELMPGVGDFVPGGAPVFRVYAEPGAVSDPHLFDFVAMGEERTSRQDSSYSIRILVDIAIRALSPAVNDPTTATQSLDIIEDLLLLLGSRQLPDGKYRDEGGTVRLVCHTPTWEEYLELALTEIRTYGAGSPQTVERLQLLLRRVREAAPDWRTAAVDEQAGLLEAAVAQENDNGSRG